jgi:hypothetical protein
METKHSPAPWRACHNGDCSCGQVWSTTADSCVAHTLSASDNEFGEACKVADKSDEFKANMRLIAAAPELLESVMNLVGMFDTPAGRRRQTDMQKEALALAHKAIMKAITGKEEP